MLIYKIFRPAEWAELERDGTSKGAPIDVADGYIHFSTAKQVEETVARYFSGARDLVIAALEADALSPLKWEKSRGGALFPHLYRDLARDDILWAKPLPAGAEGHDFTGLL